MGLDYICNKKKLSILCNNADPELRLGHLGQRTGREIGLDGMCRMGSWNSRVQKQQQTQLS